MANLMKTLPSGATLEATLSSFEECDRLFSAVMQEAELVKFEIGGEFQGFQKMMESGVSGEMINTLKNFVCRLVRSEAVKAALTPCLGRALYNNVKIDKETFQAEEARQDYFAVLREVLWFNLRPFFGKNSFKLSGIFQSPAASTQT